MPFPKSHRFRGIRYKLRWRKPPRTRKEIKAHKKGELDIFGRCYQPEKGLGGLMYLNPKVDPVELADTVVHESLHACLPDLDEARVTDTTETIFSLFRRMGMKVTFIK